MKWLQCAVLFAIKATKFSKRKQSKKLYDIPSRLIAVASIIREV